MSKWIDADDAPVGMFVDEDGRLLFHLSDDHGWAKLLTQTKRVGYKTPATKVRQLSWESLSDMRGKLREQIRKEGIR